MINFVQLCSISVNFIQFCFLPILLGLFTTANYKTNYRKKIRDSVCVVAKARNTNSEFNILLTAKNDFMKNDSNKIDISTSIPISMSAKKI